MRLWTTYAANTMEIQADFAELLKLFNAQSVEYVIVGGYALAYHGAPRFTGDLDIFVKPDLKNAQRIVAALGMFGFASLASRPMILPSRIKCYNWACPRCELT